MCVLEKCREKNYENKPRTKSFIVSCNGKWKRIERIEFVMGEVISDIRKWM